jgi:uncharacterized protein (DUF2267 family)
MPLNFNQYASEGNAFLKDYAREMDLEGDPAKAARILTAILHALRELITPEESVQLIAQFPMFLKAVYVNGWKLKKQKPRVKKLNEFIALVRKLVGSSADSDFEYKDEVAEQYIDATLIYLRKYVSHGEMEDIRGILPTDLKGLIHTKLTF